MDTFNKIKGYLAFIDILGFSALKNEDFSEKFAAYHEIVSNACPQNHVNYNLYSDSLILYTNTLGKDPLMQLLSAVSKTTYGLLMKLDMPVRGCVSAGEFTINKGGGSVVIAGKPLIDAYEYEKKQDWVGIMLSPRLVKLHQDLESLTTINNIYSKEAANNFAEKLPWPLLVQRCRMIPFHTDRPNYLEDNQDYDGYVVVPSQDHANPKDLIHDLKEFNEQLEKLQLLALTPSQQKKYQKAINWVGVLHKKWLMDVINSGYWHTRNVSE
ncbi:MAG: hypothetical protein HZA00_04490 [Nitrospinae bacterium]|nr:hypothetical protein [Nitrospinota bacterium]